MNPASTRRRAALVAQAAALGALATTGSAPTRAETPDYDCGPAGAYQYGAAWPGHRACATGLGSSRAVGPAVIVDKIAAWNGAETPYAWITPLAGAVSPPTIARNGRIYLSAGTDLHAIRDRFGSIAWSTALGAEAHSAPAIGVDGTIYTATVAGRVVAVKPTGAVKWTYELPGGPAVHASLLLGPGGRVYVADTAGTLTALVDGGAAATAATVAWTATLGAGVEVTPAMSRTGSRLYVGTSAGALSAVNTANGAIVWTAAVAAGQASSPVVDAAGTIYVGGTSGKLYALAAATGAVVWERALGLAVRTPVLDAAGSLFVFAAVDATSDRLFEVASDGTVLWQDDGKHLAPVVGPLVDSEGYVYAAAAAGLYMPVTGWQLSFGWGKSHHLAMSSMGSLIIVRDNRILSLGPGEAPAPFASTPGEPITPPLDSDNDGVFDDGATSSSANTVRYCKAAPVLGPATPSRPGMSYVMKKWNVAGNPVCAAADYKKPECRLASVTLGAQDEDCPVTFCKDDEKQLPIADGTKLLSTSGGHMPASLPAAYDDRSCEAAPPPVMCNAIDATKVVWSETLCGSDDACDAGYVCARVCKTAGQTTGTPAATCKPSQIKRQCAKVDTARCGGLPAYATGTGAEGCHEVRECAADDDKVTAAEAEPLCHEWKPGGGAFGLGQLVVVACDKAMPPAAVKNKVEQKAAYPALGLWTSATPEALCKLGQNENAEQDVEGGRSPDSARNKKKKWGLMVRGKADADFDLNPEPFGMFKPDIGASASFKILARVMGNDITVIGINGDAHIRGCDVGASATTTLFNQDIHAYDVGLAPADDGGEGCGEFFGELEFLLGDIKKSLVMAARMRSIVDDMQAYNDANLSAKKIVGVTREMCVAALPKKDADGNLIDNPVCATTASMTRARAAEIANKFVDPYNKRVAELETTLTEARTKFLRSWLAKLEGKGFGVTSDGSFGYEADVPVVPGLGQEFSLVGARAVFPIGPLALVLEVQGTGGWAISGSLTYGAQLFGSNGLPEPGFKALGTVTPSAHVDVDVFVGVGYDFGIGGAAVGFGGYITLVNIEAPVKGGMVLKLQGEEVSDDTTLGDPRTWPADLKRFQTPELKLGRKRWIYKWKQEGQIGAALSFTFLKGELDVRLRVRFLFFSKTWKKRIAKLPGLHKDINWTGTLAAPDLLGDGFELSVLDPLPLPKLPRFSADDFWFPDAAASVPWPAPSAFATPQLRTRVGVMNSHTNLGKCEPPPPVIF